MDSRLHARGRHAEGLGGGGQVVSAVASPSVLHCDADLMHSLENLRTGVLTGLPPNSLTLLQTLAKAVARDNRDEITVPLAAFSQTSDVKDVARRTPTSVARGSGISVCPPIAVYPRF